MAKRTMQPTTEDDRSKQKRLIVLAACQNPALLHWSPMAAARRTSYHASFPAISPFGRPITTV